MSEWIKAKAMTRDDVIKALECCTSGNIENCQICPVEAQSELPTHYCITVLLCEALALLKQEPKRGKWEGWTGTHWTGKYDDLGDPEYKEHVVYHCSLCGRRTVIRENYCPTCGARMEED